MTPPPYDPTSPHGLGQQTPRPPKRGGSILPRLVVFAACVGVLVYFGTDRVREAFDSPTDDVSIWILVALAIGLATGVGLFVRLGRGAPPEQPLAHTSADASSIQVAPVAGPVGPSTTPRSLKLIPLIVTVAIIAAVAFGIVQLVQAAKDGKLDIEVPTNTPAGSTVSLPDLTKDDDGCGEAEPGEDVLDSAATDCAPLDVDDLLPAQGGAYRRLAADQTSSCDEVAANRRAKRVLDSKDCTDVLRALYLAPDRALVGATSIIVFETRDDAVEALEQFGEKSAPITAIDTPPKVGLPAGQRIDELKPGMQCISRFGRYVICSMATMVDQRDTSPGVPIREQGMVSVLGLTSLSPLLGRRFDSIG